MKREIKSLEFKLDLFIHAVEESPDNPKLLNKLYQLKCSLNAISEQKWPTLYYMELHQQLAGIKYFLEMKIHHNLMRMMSQYEDIESLAIQADALSRDSYFFKRRPIQSLTASDSDLNSDSEVAAVSAPF